MKTKDITLNAIMITILIICSQLTLPIGPVPITLQTLAVLMIGYLLTPKNTLFATGIYLLMGLAGLPVFSSFSGGLQAILLPSFGFIIGFVPAAYSQALYLKKRKSAKLKDLALSGSLNFTITYAIGLPYMAFILNFYLDNTMGAQAILTTGLLPFIPGDFFKLAIGTLIAKRLLPIVRKRLTIL